MKKFSGLLSALLVSCLTVTTAFAAAQVKVDNISVNSGNITVPVVLSELPEGLLDLSAVTVRYEYDKDKMKYVSTEGVLLTKPANTAGNISWFDPDQSGAGKITAEALSEANGILANINFTKVSGATGKAEVKITFVELADSKLNVTKTVETVDGSIDFGGSGGGSGSGGGGGGGGGGSSSKNNNKNNTNKTDDTKTDDTKTDDTKTDDTKTDDTKNDNTSDTDVSEIKIADIPTDNWAYASAEALIKKGIISGDGTEGAVVLRPNDAITREEAAKMALLAMNVQPESGLELNFADSAEISDWAKDYIATAVKYNAISGYVDNTVRSKNTISREEMITMLIKAFKWGTSDNELTFADNDKITWSKPYLAQAIALGVLKGYDDNTIRPDAKITRAESFALIERCIKLNDALTK